MDAIRGVMAGHRRLGRRWFFGSAVLDEGSWTLLVDGRRVAIETKPLELLHALLLRAGDVVTKDELLDAVWPDVSVVEASLTTAILKLRRALGDEKGEGRIIETAPRIGYRLAVPVRLEAAGSAPSKQPASVVIEASSIHEPSVDPKAGSARGWLIVGGLALASVAGALVLATLPQAPPAAAAGPVTQADAASALRRLDVAQIEAMLRAGWSPNTPFNVEGDGALNMLLNVCEWDRGHDRQKLLLVARTLLEGGAALDARNSFGDTAYSIAKAPRFCGPEHPVTEMLRTLCYASGNPLGDRCLATYAAPKS